jgi:hypothetical protein
LHTQNTESFERNQEIIVSMRLQKVFNALCEKAFNPLPTALILWKQEGEVKLVIQVKAKVICVPAFFAYYVKEVSFQYAVHKCKLSKKFFCE